MLCITTYNGCIAAYSGFLFQSGKQMGDGRHYGAKIKNGIYNLFYGLIFASNGDTDIGYAQNKSNKRQDNHFKLSYRLSDAVPVFNFAIVHGCWLNQYSVKEADGGQSRNKRCHAAECHQKNSNI